MYHDTFWGPCRRDEDDVRRAGDQASVLAGNRSLALSVIIGTRSSGRSQRCTSAPIVDLVSRMIGLVIRLRIRASATSQRPHVLHGPDRNTRETPGCTGAR